MTRHMRIPRSAVRIISSAGQFVTTDELRAVVPSVFAVEPHESRSERFHAIPTMSIINRLRDEGWGVTMAAQMRTKDEGRRDFTKHMLRFRRTDADTHKVLGMVFPEVVLFNANDGAAAYRLNAGLMRLVCLNGMTVSDEDYGSVHVTHTGDVMGKVIEGTYEVLDESRKALSRAERWSKITLSHQQQMAFAQRALAIRFADAEGKIKTPIKAGALLSARRVEDEGDSLWQVVNRIQENIIRGGLSGVGTDRHNRPRHVTTRPVLGIDQDQRINRALWRAAEKLAA